MAVTAKVKLQSKSEFLSNSYGTSKEKSSELTFVPNYGEGKNSSWAAYTPNLTFKMTVKEEVAKFFEVGSEYTVTFTPDEKEVPEAPMNEPLPEAA